MKLPAKEIRRRVHQAIRERYGNQTVDFASLLDIIYDTIEEREKYRDRRA